MIISALELRLDRCRCVRTWNPLLFVDSKGFVRGGSSAEVCDRGQPNWPWLRRSPAPSSGRRGRRGSGRRIMPAAALAAPVKPKETVKNPVGSTFSPESNSLVPKRDGEDVQVCYVMLSFCSFVKRCHLSLQLVFSSSSPSLCNKGSCQREERTHFLSCSTCSTFYHRLL